MLSEASTGWDARHCRLPRIEFTLSLSLVEELTRIEFTLALAEKLTLSLSLVEEGCRVVVLSLAQLKIVPTLSSPLSSAGRKIF